MKMPLGKETNISYLHKSPPSRNLGKSHNILDLTKDPFISLTRVYIFKHSQLHCFNSIVNILSSI